MSTDHHAELIQTDEVESFDVSILTDDSFVRDEYFEKLGINEARALVTQAHQRPAHSDFQYLVVRTDFITLEAQNALLKTLEEPPLSTKIIFVVPRDFIVIPTLRSRFNLSNSGPQPERKDNIEFDIFIKGSYKERLEQIDVAIKKKDLSWQKEVKRGLINYLEITRLDDSTVLTKLEFVTRNLLTRGSSNKMLLEQAALVLNSRL